MFYLASDRSLGAINNNQALYSKEMLHTSESLSRQQKDEAAAGAELIYLKW